MSTQELQGKVEFTDEIKVDSKLEQNGLLEVNGDQKQKATRAAGNTDSHLDAASGVGVHEYYEVVTFTTADDNDVAGSLSKKLPGGCVMIDAGLGVVEIAT